MSDLPSRLRRLLDERGLSVAEVARDAGMSRQQLHALLSSPDFNPTVGTLARIVAAVGGTMGELFADDEE